MKAAPKEVLCACGHLKKDHEEGGEGVCTICRRDHTVGLIGCPSYNPGRKKVDPFEYELAERKRDAIKAIEALFECARRARTDIDPHAMSTPASAPPPAPPIAKAKSTEIDWEAGGVHTFVEGSSIGKGEEAVLILIASSANGMTSPQIAVKTKYSSRTVSNLTSALKKEGLASKIDERWHATASGREAVKGKTVAYEKGAILEDLTPLEREILLAIAAHPEGATDAMLAAIVQRATARSRSNALSSLRNTYEFIEKREGRHVLRLHAREELSEHIPKPLKGKALREKCKGELPAPERAVFEVLEHTKSPAPIAEIAEVLDYAERSVENIVARLKAREIIERTPVGPKLSDVFFE